MHSRNITSGKKRNLTNLNAQRKTEEKKKLISKFSGRKRDRVRFYLLLPSRKDENRREKKTAEEGGEPHACRKPYKNPKP